MVYRSAFETYKKTSAAAWEAALELQRRYFENISKAFKTALDFQKTGLELTKRNMQVAHDALSGWQATAKQTWAEVLKLEPQELEKWQETFFKPVEENQQRTLALMQQQMDQLFDLTQSNIERNERTFSELSAQARQSLEGLLQQYDQAAKTLSEAVEEQMTKLTQQVRSNFSRSEDYWREVARSLTVSEKELKQLRKTVEELQAKVTKLEKAKGRK